MRYFRALLAAALLILPPAMRSQNAADVVANNNKIAALNALIAKSQADMNAGDYASAIEALKQVIAEEPDVPSLWIRLGRAQLTQANAARKANATDPTVNSKFNDAASSDRKAISLNSTVPQPDAQIEGTAEFELGSALIYSGQIEEGISWFEKAAKNQPTQAGLYYRNEAVELYNTNHLDKVAQAADRAIVADPNSALPYFIKAQALVVGTSVDPKTGKLVPPQGGKEAYAKYLQLEPSSPQADIARRVLATFEGQDAPNRARATDGTPSGEVAAGRVPQQPTGDQEDSGSQEKISQLQSDIQSQEQFALNDESSANQLLNNCSGPGAALCQALGQAGAARLRQKAAEARNQADSDREEIERLQGEEVQSRQRRDTTYGGSLQQVTTETGTSIQSAAAQRQANLQAMAAANQQRQQAQAPQPAPSTSAPAARSSSVNTATTVPATTAAADPAPSTSGNNPYSSSPAQGSYNPYTGTGSGSTQGSCTDMTGSVQGTVKIGSDGWVSGYLTNNSNQALFVSYTFKQNGVPSTAMANAGGTTIQGGQTVGGEGQGLYSTSADKNPPEIYWYAVLKSDHDKYGCAHRW